MLYLKCRRCRRNVVRMKIEMRNTCLFEYWRRWAVPSTIITALVHFWKRDAAAVLPHAFNSTSLNRFLLASLVRNALKSLGFLVADPSRVNCFPHPCRCFSYVLTESGLKQSLERIKLFSETIRSRICKQILPNVGGKSTSLRERAFPSWMSM